MIESFINYLIDLSTHLYDANFNYTCKPIANDCAVNLSRQFSIFILHEILLLNLIIYTT